MSVTAKTPKVEHEDVPIIKVPNEVPFEVASLYCAKKAEEENAEFPFLFEFEALPFEGAHALANVLDKDYSATRDVQAFNPPKQLGGFEKQVPSALGNISVWWGRWNLAGLGYTWPDVAKTQDGNLVFRLMCKAPRKHKARVAQLFDRLRAEISKHQLYAGVALLLKPDENGQIDLMTPPKVISVPSTTAADVYLKQKTMSAVRAELFSSMSMEQQLREHGQHPRRGVLLVGPPGTGKSMCATIAANLAIKAGWAVFYLTDAEAFEQALSLAQAHEPALLIVEDVDRKMSGERTSEIDRILNALSGVAENKRIVTICTSNDASDLPSPMLRPGRMDSTIFFEAPDADTASRLLRHYLAQHAPKDATVLARAGDLCQGLLPAFIQEVATRSIRHALTFGALDGVPSAEDILNSATNVRRQQELLEEREKKRFRVPKTEVRVVTETPPDQRQDPGLLGEQIAASVVGLLKAAQTAATDDILGKVGVR